MNDYSYWIKQIDKYYPKFRAAKERKKNPTTRQRSAPKCGFCSDENHNRRNCPELATFAKRLKQANANWRQAVFSKLVTEMGLGIGAVVKVKDTETYWNRANQEPPKELIGIVDTFDLSSCNLFCVNTKIDSDYRAGIEVTAVAGDNQTRLKFSNPHNKRESIQDDKGRGALVGGTGYYYNSNEYLSTVARSTQPLDESWVSTGALEDEFNWLLKKRSLQWLADHGVLRQVEVWE
jgi:hypothetical protein